MSECREMSEEMSARGLNVGPTLRVWKTRNRPTRLDEKKTNPLAETVMGTRASVGAVRLLLAAASN